MQLRDHACVFWDYTVNDWSTAGCAKGRDQFLRCRCNHTTNFAVLMVGCCPFSKGKSLGFFFSFVWLFSTVRPARQCKGVDVLSWKAQEFKVSPNTCFWPVAELANWDMCIVPRVLESQTYWRILAASDTNRGCAHWPAHPSSRGGLGPLIPLAQLW